MSAPVCRPECGTTYGGSGETQWASTALLWCSAACAKAKRPLNPAGASEPATRPLSERWHTMAPTNITSEINQMELEADFGRQRLASDEMRIAELEADLAAANGRLERANGARENLGANLSTSHAEVEALRVELAEAEADALGMAKTADFERRQATARVRDMREACAKAARKYAQDNSNGLAISTGEGIAEAIERLPDDAGADTVTMLDVHEDPVTGEPLFTPATVTDGEGATTGRCIAPLCDCKGTLPGHWPVLTPGEVRDAIAAAVTAANKRAADAFQDWRRVWAPFVNICADEFEAHLRAGCPAPGEAPVTEKGLQHEEAAVVDRVPGEAPRRPRRRVFLAGPGDIGVLRRRPGET